MGLPWTPMGPTCPLGQGSYGLPPFSVRLVARGSMRLEGPLLQDRSKGVISTPMGPACPWGQASFGLPPFFVRLVAMGSMDVEGLIFLECP